MSKELNALVHILGRFENYFVGTVQYLKVLSKLSLMMVMMESQILPEFVQPSV